MCGLMLTWRKRVDLSRDVFPLGNYNEANASSFSSAGLAGASEIVGSRKLVSGGIKFLSAKNSPTGKAVLLVANEVIGKTEMYEME